MGANREISIREIHSHSCIIRVQIHIDEVEPSPQKLAHAIPDSFNNLPRGSRVETLARFSGLVEDQLP